MAGTFWHLTLAQRALPLITGDWPEGDRDLLTRAFCAGSIAPDLGFFPGGPASFSRQLHHQATGDFLRALYRSARDSRERAFAAGWALHLYTDLTIHPWINQLAGDVMAGLEGGLVNRSDLWHLRIENGIDCHFLAQLDCRFLWTLNIDWGEGVGAELLAAVGSDFFSGLANQSSLQRGLVSQRRWVARLPRIFLLTGHTSPAWLRYGSAIGRLLRPVVSTVVGDWFGGATGWDNVGAVAHPLRADADTQQRAGALGPTVLEVFDLGLRNGFSSLANVDLDTGKAL